VDTVLNGGFLGVVVVYIELRMSNFHETILLHLLIFDHVLDYLLFFFLFNLPAQGFCVV
jgi:hypothetical protein